jgi:hypothetical protein
VSVSASMMPALFPVKLHGDTSTVSYLVMITDAQVYNDIGWPKSVSEEHKARPKAEGKRKKGASFDRLSMIRQSGGEK